MATLSRVILLLCVTQILFLSAYADAQPVYDNIYRPAHPAWQQLTTQHFRIIYQKGEESAAIRSAQILEDQYSVIQTLVGGSLTNMPVVLNSANDRSNGYVTTLNFRIEVEIPRLLGKSMNPRDGNWLNTVMPHELVHALHLNVIPSFGVAGLIRPFSPDAARTIHMAAPLGMIEGIAVFHESHLHYGISGRGNYPFFTGQYQAVNESRDPWTPSRHLREPVSSYPFDRHYIGGFTFINWLQYEYGMETTSQTIRFVSRWPFLGYGTALWYHTGERPSRLFREFEIAQKTILSENEPDRQEFFASPLPDEFKRVRRPFWISDQTVLFHAASYNKRPGIFGLDAQTNEYHYIFETLSTQDYLFTPHPEEPRFLYSRYHRHPYKENYYRMRIHEAEWSQSGSGHESDMNRLGIHSKQAVHSDRTHAPVYGPDNRIWSLRTHHENNVIIQFSEHEPDTLLIPDNGHIVEFSFHPVYGDSLILLGNRNGVQGLWFLHRDHLSNFNSSPPDIAFEQASIFDPDWHPDGDRLLFSADMDGTMNLYEYHTREQQVVQLSRHRWGLMEGRYSPDGHRIAAVQLHENRFELVILDNSNLPDLNRVEADAVPFMDGNHSSFSDNHTPFETFHETVSSIPDNWKQSTYRTGIGWLRPRSLFPFWYNESTLTGNRYGLTMSSGDVLRRNSYIAELSTSNNRIWYNLSYRYTGFYPGFRVQGYHRPAETTSGLQERQGGSFEVPIPVHFDQNTRFSSLIFVPAFSFIQQRPMTTTGEVSGNRVQSTAFSLSITYNHRLQRNIRDIQPNTGWIIFAETEMDLTSDFERGKLRAMRGGIFRFLTPSLKSNQSLRIGTELVTQNLPIYDITGFYSRGFGEYILSGVNNAARINTRYTIPIWMIDRGSLVLPFFFDRLYMVAFSDTVVPLTSRNTSELYQLSRSLFGSGIRLQMRLFNIPVDIGIAFSYEPTRDNHLFYMGSF